MCQLLRAQIHLALAIDGVTQIGTASMSCSLRLVTDVHLRMKNDSVDKVSDTTVPT